MIRPLIAGLAVAAVCTMPSQAAQSKPSGSAQKPAAPRTGSARISVKDQDGASLSGVRLSLTGAGTGDFVTGGAGTAVVSDLKDGTYRLRCEVEKYITLEREFTVRGGAYSQVDVVLHAAPPPPPPPPAPAPTAPAPVPAGAPAIPSGGRSTSLSIVDFLDKNLIGGREPLKESVLACNPLETVRLLQMRERVAPHVHDRNDEVLYVVAG